MMTAAPRVTVVVPTRDRAEALARCLTALDRQTFTDFEVIVVDDRSRRPEQVRAVAGGSPRVRVLGGEGRGPAAARNLGASEARGEVVAFTDDDCRPGERWLAELGRFLDGGAAVVAGPTRPGNERATVRASQLVTNHLVDESRDGTGAVGFAPTCNIAARRPVCAAVPFDETYPAAAGEDRAWCDHLRAAGFRIELAPDAWILHEPDLSLSGFWRQQTRYGAGACRYLRTVPSGPRPQPWGFYTRLLRRAFGDGAGTGALVVVSQVATVLGVAGEAYRARAAR